MINVQVGDKVKTNDYYVNQKISYFPTSKLNLIKQGVITRIEHDIAIVKVKNGKERSMNIVFLERLT